jgi:hypothetical protein
MNLRRRNTTKRWRTKEFLNNDGCLPRLAVPSPRDKGQSCGHVVQAHFHRWKVRKIGQKLCSGVSGEAAELQGWKPGATNWRHADERDFCATLVPIQPLFETSDVTSPSIYLDFISVTLGSERKATVLATYCFSIRIDQPNYPA